MKQMIAACDKKGNITGEIERWVAHEKGILHRAFTLVILYKSFYILQHRKHPLFDGTFDATSSSHQLMSHGKLESTIESATRCLFREWKIDKKNVGKFRVGSQVYYKARDPKSIYTEHEICDVVEVTVKKLPEVNLEVAYGFSLLTKRELYNKKNLIYPLLDPWVKVMLSKGLL